MNSYKISYRISEPRDGGDDVRHRYRPGQPDIPEGPQGISAMEPREITQAEVADLLASGYETGRYEPLGLFLVEETSGAWTGIDNSTGHAWTEEFGTQAECLDWLKGENEVG